MGIGRHEAKFWASVLVGLAWTCGASVLSAQAPAPAEGTGPESAGEPAESAPSDQQDQDELSQAQKLYLETFRRRMEDLNLYTSMRSFIQADRNGDDRVTLEEWLAATRSRKVHWGGGAEDFRKYYTGVFQQADRDKDGFWTRSEALAAIRERISLVVQGRKHALLKLDVNRNGRIDPVEERQWAQELARQRFEAQDDDADGNLTLTEILPKTPPEKESIRRSYLLYLQRRDADSDGQISRQEFLDWEARQFRVKGLFKIPPQQPRKDYAPLVLYGRGGRISPQMRRQVAGAKSSR